MTIDYSCQTVKCADCGGDIGKDHGPQDGWQLEDGRTVCQACCVADTKLFCDFVKSYKPENITITYQTVKCAICGGSIGKDHDPQDGWKLEDGRTVCQVCCAAN